MIFNYHRDNKNKYSPTINLTMNGPKLKKIYDFAKYFALSILNWNVITALNYMFLLVHFHLLHSQICKFLE